MKNGKVLFPPRHERETYRCVIPMGKGDCCNQLERKSQRIFNSFHHISDVVIWCFDEEFECFAGVNGVYHLLYIGFIIETQNNNTLQHAATHFWWSGGLFSFQHMWHILQQAATHRNPLLFPSATHSSSSSKHQITTRCNKLQHTLTHFELLLQHTRVHNRMCRPWTRFTTATHCNALQRTATHCDALQHYRLHHRMCRSWTRLCCSVLQLVAACCFWVFGQWTPIYNRFDAQCNVCMCCSMLQRVAAACCRVLLFGCAARRTLFQSMIYL